MSVKKKLAIVLCFLLGLGLVIQLVPTEHCNPQPSRELSAPPEVRAILQTSCYDCHSNSTRWPWYSQVAPVSWWISDHVREGREHLNFSIWWTYSASERREHAEEILEEIEDGEMPPLSYTLVHGEARISEAERQTLAEWLSTMGEPE